MITKKGIESGLNSGSDSAKPPSRGWLSGLPTFPDSFCAAQMRLFHVLEERMHMPSLDLALPT